MKTTSKRLVGILLCLAMVLAVLPMAVSAAGTTKLYCAAPSSWSSCNVYWWGSSTGTSWPGEAMTQGSDGLWYYAVPSDATNVIFNNGNGTQTADLDMPADNKVQWNYDAKEWVTYGSDVPVVETVYYLRGTMNGWGATDALTKQADGTYAITVSLAAGTYEYKVGTEDWGWSCPAENAALTVEVDGNVTFVLNVDAYTVTVTGAGEPAPEPQPDPMVIESVIAVGEGSGNFLYDVEWDPAFSLNGMEETEGVYTITYMGVAAGTYEYKFAANGTWGISWGAGCETVSGETYDAYYNGNNNILNVAVDNSTVILTLDLTGMDYVTGAGAKCSVEIIEPAVSSAPEALVLGSNNYAIASGDSNPVSSTYIVEKDGILSVTPSAMTTAEGEVPAAYIPMQFGRMYALIVNGEQVWLPCEIEVAAGDEVTVAVMSYMGAETAITIDLAIREPGVKDVKWQLAAGTNADSATTDLRLISWVDSLDYSNVSFNVSVDGVAMGALSCNKVYTAVKANGNTYSASDLFGDNAAYIVTYVITGVPASAFDSEFEVTVTWTDLYGNETNSETRTFVISDKWA